MDLYLINGQDGISLPEMIDWDIKLSDSEISEEVGVNNLMGLGYDLPSLDIDEEPNPLWSHNYSANSNSSFELDFLGEGASTMVDPSSVMPFVPSLRAAVNSSGLHTTPPTAENEQTKEEAVRRCGKVKVEVEDEDVEEGRVEEVSESDPGHKIIALPVEFISVPMDNSFVEVSPAKKAPLHKRQVAPSSDVDTLKTYPKPAYSYSCLIAMALKNSQAGSLPVSEIYSFMCHHFPYFKTAPNGWKNSVRHNLSLNKCFEKIEKPPGTGPNGSQRKGCLWAMNPAKITKMDDEVAKWSKKDPFAIKKAMVCPDHLELLERGEMKDEAAFVEEEVEEDSEEVKDEEEVDEDFGLDVEDDRISPIDDDSDEEMSRVPPSLQPFEPKFAQYKRQKVIAKSNGLLDKSVDFTTNIDFEVSDSIYDDLDVTDTKTLLGLDDSTPVYAVDPIDENLLIELPLVKRPRVQGNYVYQPVMTVKRHDISGFRSIQIQSP